MSKRSHELSCDDLWKFDMSSESDPPEVTEQNYLTTVMASTKVGGWALVCIERRAPDHKGDSNPYLVNVYSKMTVGEMTRPICESKSFPKIKEALEFANQRQGDRVRFNRHDWLNGSHVLLRNPSRSIIQAALNAVAASPSCEMSLRVSAREMEGPQGAARNEWRNAKGLAWWTDGLGDQYVRVWSANSVASAQSSSWSLVFPERAQRLAVAMRRRTRAALERMGPEGVDDRLQIREPVIVARSHEGLLVADDEGWPRVAQVVVRDSTTGLRHHIGVPLRFVNRDSRTFQRLGGGAARVHAAIAWTFGLKPDQYTPLVEA
jgi:hypothetical protein